MSEPGKPARTVLVTGASSGFGAAIARDLAALGWPVALGARRVDKLDAVAKAIQDAGGKAFAHPLDVTDRDSIDAFVHAAETSLGPADVVISNAGVGIPGLAHEVSPDAWRTEIDTNLLGPMLLARRVLPALIERRRGDIVFVTSLNATQPRPFQSGYSAAKAGLENFAQTLKLELEGTGVRSTIVRPGPSQTEMGWDWDPELVKPMLKSWKRFGVLRHHRFLQPEDVAGAVRSVVTAPTGTHLDLVQINPEAPLEES